MSRDAVDVVLGAVVILAACFLAPILFLLIVLLILIGVAVHALVKIIDLFEGRP